MRAPGELARLAPSGRSILIGLMLLVGCAGAYLVARESSLFAVRTIEVSGANARVASEVRAALRPELGTSLVMIDPEAVRRRLATVPDVQSATLDRAFPHTLAVTVTPERALAVLRQGAGAWLVSTWGRVLRPIERGTARSLPRIWVGRGATIEPGRTLALDDGGRAVAALAPIAGTGFGPRILYVRTSPDEVTLVLRSGVELRLGDLGDLRLKLAIARRILRATGSRVTAGDYLDVSVPERPVAAVKSQVGG